MNLVLAHNAMAAASSFYGDAFETLQRENDVLRARGEIVPAEVFAKMRALVLAASNTNLADYPPAVGPVLIELIGAWNAMEAAKP